MATITIGHTAQKLTWKSAPALATRWAESMGAEYTDRDLEGRNLLVAALLEQLWAFLEHAAAETTTVTRALQSLGDNHG